jgi:cytidine deaminase
MRPTKQEIDDLITRAIMVRRNAYAPYSKYAVGAALISGSGKIYEGANVENAVYSLGICAERTAIFKAVSAGERTIRFLVVATENGGSPCGACRQVIYEFGKDVIVMTVNGDGKVVLEAPISEFLPHSFGPDDLSSG